ncbi:helix-turn-helix domain-containing protein [Parabacteroides sp. OttesenSCG-928-G21]|nr:helix-turn-helix domain-containing protein [Parabacteroides sp. OttesenSCG-928-G21]
MSRRKKITIKAKDTSVYRLIVSELSKNPELADYDMSSIEIIIKKKIEPTIKDADKAISNLQQYYAANKQFIQTFNGKQLISKKDLAKMLRVSRPTVDKWLEHGFIKPSRIAGTSFDCFQIDEVIEQLRKQKQ